MGWKAHPITLAVIARPSKASVAIHSMTQVIEPTLISVVTAMQKEFQAA
ncbi:MAG: hypothetical protein J6W29_07130 [Neisseriaceae bacterium]|nr:hypothetical protein [Neisseriaceae bacterium]MBP5789988.1 hypothetical protein [Neisseriaceae bacterium]